MVRAVYHGVQSTKTSFLTKMIEKIYDNNGNVVLQAIDGILYLYGSSVSLISNSSVATREILQLRAKTDCFDPGNDGSGINLYGDGDSVNPGQIVGFVKGWSQLKVIPALGAVADNAYLGIGKEHDPRYPFEVYFNDENSILSISAAGGTSFDPILQFNVGTGATPARVGSFGADANDSNKLKVVTGNNNLRGSSSFVFFGDYLGIGTDAPERHVHIKSTSGIAPAVRIEGNCKSQLTNSIAGTREIFEIRAKESLANGSGINLYGNGDSSLPGAIALQTGGSARFIVQQDGTLRILTIKSGATQAGAGAAANEPWITSGHASLPDNVMMYGV